MVLLIIKSPSKMSYADSVAPGQTARMRRRIWGYNVRIWQTTIVAFCALRVKKLSLLLVTRHAKKGFGTYSDGVKSESYTDRI